MCWINIQKQLVKSIANEDRVVYKLVYKANKYNCISLFKSYQYNSNSLEPIIPLNILTNEQTWCVIREGYHSYTKIDNSRIYKSGAFQVGGFTQQLMYKKMNQTIYIAKFIIPKGSEYYVNKCGEIVSSRIKYTGEFVVGLEN